MSNDRQGMVQRCYRADDKRNFANRSAKVKWMEDFRRDMLEDLEIMIRANFAKEEIPRVKSLPGYGWTYRKVKHTKIPNVLMWCGHTCFVGEISEWRDEIGSVRCGEKIKYGLDFVSQERRDRCGWGAGKRKDSME